MRRWLVVSVATVLLTACSAIGAAPAPTSTARPAVAATAAPQRDPEASALVHTYLLSGGFSGTTWGPAMQDAWVQDRSLFVVTSLATAAGQDLTVATNICQAAMGYVNSPDGQAKALYDVRVLGQGGATLLRGGPIYRCQP